MKADEGERWGFFSRLVEPDRLMDEAQALARSLAEGPTFAHAVTKAQLDAEWSVSLEQAIDMEAEAQADCMETADFHRAYEAFLAKLFDENHRRLADDLEDWCHDVLPAVAPKAGEDQRSRALAGALGKAGFLQHCVTAPFGRSERLDLRSLALIRETLAFHDPLADFAFAMQGLGSGTISLFGSPEQQSRWLPAVAAGEAIAAFALTEPAAGSDVAATETSARQDVDGFVLDGAKTYISNGGIADFYVVFARTGEAPGARGLSAFLVERGTAGLDDTERIEVIAPHPLAMLKFAAMRLPGTALIGELGRGFQQAMATLDLFRPTVGAAALGFARRALAEATARAKQRVIGGAPLADNPLIRAQLADAVVAVESAALLVYRACWTHDVARRRHSREAAIAKLAATESAQAVIDRAVQIFGGLGVTSGAIVERLYRDIRALRIYEGASEVQQMVIAKHHLEDA
jgi:acyl-CoA dehydrogenase